MNKPRAQDAGSAQITSQEREQQTDYAGTSASLATTALYYPHAPTEEDHPRNRNQTPHPRHPHNPAQDQIPSRHLPTPPPRTKHPLRHSPIPPPPPQNAPPPPRRNPNQPQHPNHWQQRARNPNSQSSSTPTTHRFPLQSTCGTRTIRL
jgi:hypothetical protein